MLKISIIEDQEPAQELLKSFLGRYATEKNLQLDIVCYGDAFSFLERYKKGSDIIFMDIELPGINGMEAACRLRETDNMAVLIFVTNMAQYAVKGYEVDALDFVVKPLQYSAFCMKMDKAVRVVGNAAEKTINIVLPGKVVRIDVRDLCYVEVMGHKLYYHTEQGVYEGRGAIGEEEERLRPYHFMRCNSCYLINPLHVKTVGRNEVTMRSGEVLPVSHSKRKNFLTEIAEYLGNDR